MPDTIPPAVPPDVLEYLAAFLRGKRSGQIVFEVKDGVVMKGTDTRHRRFGKATE